MVLLLCGSSLAADLYVSPDGSDGNPGTRSKPFVTLERGRAEVRRLRQDGRLPQGGITVWLRGGDYLRTHALELSAADSGTPSAPVVWRAARGETARLLGGRPLSGFAPVTDPGVLARLPAAARGNVRQLDLAALGVTDFGRMQSRGFARPLAPAHGELFYDGRPMTLARWPNEGQTEHIAGFPEGQAQPDSHGGSIGKLDAGFFYRGDRPRRWADPAHIWVHGYWAWDWANSYERIESIDLEQRLIRTAPPRGHYGFRKGQRIYFVNVLEELDQPGEWYLDHRSGLLCFWPPAPLAQTANGGQAAAGRQSPEVLISLLAEPFIRMNEVSNVTFRGLALEATRSSAVEIRGGAGNRIAGCLIRNIGNNGVNVEGGTGHGVVSCNIIDTGDGGVALTGGDRQTLRPGSHFVENCEFARQGRWSKTYVPAVLINGVGQRASHNLIYEHPHCAILFNGNDHTIEFNEIHHYALETGDVGAVYAGRDYTYRGNCVRYNFIHDPGGVGMGSMGVYLDDCVSGAEILGNIFCKVQRAAFLGGGRDHRILNNIFVDCNPAVELDARGIDTRPVWREMVNASMRQGLAAVPPALYRERYPAMKTLDQYYGPPGGPAITGDAFKGVPPEHNVVERNICAGAWSVEHWNAQPGTLLARNNLTNAAASFVRPPGSPARVADFAVRRDSPAWKLGFEPIPLNRIGLYRDDLRKALPRL
jgi:hypothetical protein